MAQLTGGETVKLSVEGKPGVGKTTLAAVLAREHAVREHFTGGVLWASPGPDGDSMRILGQWADGLKKDDLGLDISHLTEPVDRRQAVTRLIGGRRMLLVVDDAWTLEAVRRLRCGGDNCVYLLTTRDKELARQFAGATGLITVPELAKGPAFALLQALAKEACSVDSDAARALANAVGGLPLALTLLGGYLGALQQHFFPDLSKAALAKMANPSERLKLATTRLGGKGKVVTLEEIIKFSIDRVSPEARAAFYALGAFAPKPATFSRAAAEVVAETDGATLAELGVVNLLEQVDGDLALHQTMADVAREGGLNLAVAQQRHLDHYLALANKDRENWQRIEAAYPQIRWAWENATEDRSLLALILALGIYHQRRGLWRESIVWGERGIKVAKNNNLRKDQGLLCNRIGVLYTRLGQEEEGLEFCNLALPFQMEAKDWSGLATTLNTIGHAYESLGQREKALEFYNSKLPDLEKMEDRSGFATALNNIGGIYSRQGQGEKALEFCNRALPILEEVENRSGVAIALNNIGHAYDSLGQRKKAMAHYSRALPILKGLGDRYEERVTRYKMAMILRAQGQLAEAVAQLEQVVMLDRLVQHPDLESDAAMPAQVKAELAQQGS